MEINSIYPISDPSGFSKFNGGGSEISHFFKKKFWSRGNLWWISHPHPPAPLTWNHISPRAPPEIHLWFWLLKLTMDCFKINQRGPIVQKIPSAFSWFYKGFPIWCEGLILALCSIRFSFKNIKDVVVTKAGLCPFIPSPLLQVLDLRDYWL